MAGSASKAKKKNGVEMLKGQKALTSFFAVKASPAKKKCDDEKKKIDDSDGSVSTMDIVDTKPKKLFPAAAAAAAAASTDKASPIAKLTDNSKGVMSASKLKTTRKVSTESTASTTKHSKFPLKETKVKKMKEGTEDEGKPVFFEGKVNSYNDFLDTYEVRFKEIPAETWNEDQVQWGVRLYETIGGRIAKWFCEEDGDDEKLFHGRVANIGKDDEGSGSLLFRIVYEDGDEEDLNEDEYEECKELYKKEQLRGGKGRTATSNTKRRRIIDDDDSDEDSDEGDDKMDTGRKRRAASSKTKKRKTIYDEDDDSEFEFDESNNKDDDDDSMDYVVDDEEDDDNLDSDIEDDMSEDEPKQKSKAKKTKKSASSSTSKSVSTAKSSGKKSKSKAMPADLQRELEEKMAKDRKTFKPPNNPQKWPENGPFVDPVGVDPTHGIVEGIIETQVRKVGELLKLAAQRQSDDGNTDMGELSFPIRLQTACSGTDAPSIALGIIKESLDKMTKSEDDDSNGKTKRSLFQYTHEMSCEIEPFKQAYIGRNFPEVVLYPDITKLTESEEVLDVYGRPQRVPDGNLFVAGTSCKDFSMLRTSHRQDIEDKGQSGQTFLAAVEFLEVKQPPVAIFENVYGAPWGKMQEYIEGRINLADRNDTKAIISGTGKDKKADADKQLKFSINKQGLYVAEEVPRQVGIRAGAIVEGFVKSGHDPNDVEPLLSDDRSGTKLITLGELAKKHKINLNADTLVMKKKARYCTHLCTVDTKDYGLPQTRNRKYLFIWRSDDPTDDLGEYFQEILDHLKTPLLHSMDAFLLPDTHDRIRCFREALRSGPGLMVKRERAKELDFWDWELSHVKDTTLHMVFREECGIAELSRWLTGWGIRGHKQLAPGQWPELYDCWNHRRLDMADCFAAAAIRDCISRDACHHSFTWDLSQNVTRAPFRSATVGVSGCVTPGGELLLPHKGRSVMGFEKLLLQGIPFSRLLLGPESEVQLSDLAGNAMSVSVVCATMLAAICSHELRRQKKKNFGASLADFALRQKYCSAAGAVLAQRGDLYGTQMDSEVRNFTEVFTDVANNLAQDAFLTSVLCTCESSGTKTKEPKILECSGCGFLVCHGCSDRYRTDSHELVDVVTKRDERRDPNEFERKLRCAVPSTLRLGDGWEGSLKDGEGLESYSFQLQSVDRKRGHWQLTYGAWEDHGAGRQVAEIRVMIGRTGTLGPDVGMVAYVRCFAPAIRHKKPFRGKLKDSARLIFKVGNSEGTSPVWQFPAASKKGTLKLVGSDPSDSQRIQVGLNDKAYNDLKAYKCQQKFLPPPDIMQRSRNSLTDYHKLWKTWPGTIDVSGDGSNRVNGRYERLSCTHTVVLSALWRRIGSSANQPPMYLYIRPDVIRAELDVAVFSPTPSYNDNMEICELEDWIPENALKESTHATKVTFLEWQTSPNSLQVDVPKPTLIMAPQKEIFHEKVCTLSGKSSPVLCELSGLSKEVIRSLLEYDDSSNVGDLIAMDLAGRSGTRNAKRLSIVAAPSLLKCAAEEKLPLVLSKWYRLPSSSDYGSCLINVPPRPIERWRKTSGTKIDFERYYDAEESNEYYQRLFKRPSAFEVTVSKSQGKLTVACNPYVAAHRAAAQLGGEYTGSIDVDYCLAELSSMGEPETKEFRVPNSEAYDETHVEGLELPLYKRQAKALTRMIAIESGNVPFSEEERWEQNLSGIGWCLIARASKTSPLRGGVLGDAIGSGKTVVTIALILAGAAKARANRNISEGRSSATLIVVPPGLVRQWDDERRKFTKNKLKSIVIDCTATLKRYSVEDLCSADIVIVPAGIIEEELRKGRPYTEHLSKVANAPKIPPAPQGYSQREAPTIEGTWVRNMASGPEIYVGNKGNQRKRDEQAYYGHCYSQAIAKLREKRFKPNERGVPIEWFLWNRVVIDECHESLVTGKNAETANADFKEKSRRGAREFLGVATTDPLLRPLRATTGVWGLTGTPLLETESRITELANLCGATYLCGAAHHWRKEERESGRDLFLNQQEGVKSREYRCAVHEACHKYVQEAAQRNRGEELNVKLTRKQLCVNMSQAEGEKFLKVASVAELQGFGITADQLGDKASDALSITAASKARHAALLETIDSIQEEEPDTKIIVFANNLYGGYNSALEALKGSGKEFSHVKGSDTVEKQNEIISWFRHVDATDDDRKRPRILLLSFEQAAGHNLQEACHNVIIYDPMHSGTDAVADASVEEQAVGRVMRQGQKYDVTVTRIVLKGPNGERCIDDWIVERNLDKDVLRAATSNFD